MASLAAEGARSSLAVHEVEVGALPVERFREILGPRYGEVEEAIARAREVFEGRVVWHVNSTARGGGVAELLASLLAYVRGTGIDARWAVIAGEAPFFEVTKRIHNHLHGHPGDGGALDRAAGEVYSRALQAAAGELAGMVGPRDVVFLHDPQTAGLVRPLLDSGATVVWRCHIGLDLPNELARGAWDFLRPFVEEAHALVFSREQFVWDGVDRSRVWIVPPSIDAFSPKNQELSQAAVEAIMVRTGLLEGDAAGTGSFTRMDGSPGRVNRVAKLDQEGAIPADALLATQVSRWDRLKDPIGVLEGFARAVGDANAHLLLAGPAVAAVSDDPEGEQVLAEVRRARGELPLEVRRRVHLACLPMDDLQENAAMVNAIQRRSDIVVQKSLAEGFGLTVSEAMWKARPVIASGLGGIADQIESGISGILLEDPTDLDAYAGALNELLGSEELRARLGSGARSRVEDRFLGSRHLIQYVDHLYELLSA